MSPLKTGAKQLGIVGCGAIGSAIARLVSTNKRWSGRLKVAALTDVVKARAETLSREIPSGPRVVSLEENISLNDVIVECASAGAVKLVVEIGLSSGKDILIMSVGGLIAADVRKLLKSNFPGRLFVPSGAIGGLDALRAVRYEMLDEIRLVTRKPPKALEGAVYFKEHGIDIHRLSVPERIFSGRVEEAVKMFPQNINVAASLALLLPNSKALNIEIYCDPGVTRNVHEISASGSFGQMSFKFENAPSRENPKTSQLAILSAVATLEKILDRVQIGT